MFLTKNDTVDNSDLVFEDGTILKMCSEIQPPLQSGQSGPDQSGISVVF